jgi:hypothetical protein
MKTIDAIPRMTFAAVVNAMTNWQRTQWARAGYPGLQMKEMEKALPFIERARAPHLVKRA